MLMGFMINFNIVEEVKKLEAEYERRQKKMDEKIYGKHKKDDHEVSN